MGELTADVIENNSANYTAWYYRRRCLTNEKSDLSAELEFTDRWAKDSPKNYQAWNTVPAVKRFCVQVLGKAEEQEAMCRFAVETLARVHEADGLLDEALKQYDLLKTIDKIRANYWEYRKQSLQKPA